MNEMFSHVFLVSLLWLNGITARPIQKVALHEVYKISLSTPFYSPPDLVYRPDGDSLLRPPRQPTVEPPVANVTALEQRQPSTTHEQDATEFSVTAIAIQVPNNITTLNTRPPTKMDHDQDRLHRWEFRVAFLHPGLTRVQYYEPAENDSIVTEVIVNVTVNVIAPPARRSWGTTSPSSFVQVGPNGQHFVNSLDGSTFVPIGVNVAWPDDDPSVETLADVPAFYDRWFRELAASGGNCARLWLGPGLTRKWPMLGLLKGGPPFGKINEFAAQIVDRVLESAAQHNIKLILVLESFNSLCPQWASGNCYWQESVYNDKNGGPLPGAGWRAGFLGFWGNPNILQQWETYVEYVGRRWGAYASVLAFQLFNEADIADLTPAWTVLRWHRQVLAAFRRSLGPYAPFHLLSQSWGLAWGNPVIDLPHDLLDYSTTHEYTRPKRGEQDLGKALRQLVRWKKRYGKPTLIDEFGCNDLVMQKPTGDVLHQGAWLPLFAGAAGGAMSWWWESVRAKDLLPRLTSVRKFVDEVLGQQLTLAGPGRGLEGSVVQAQSSHGARASVSGLAAYDWRDLTYTLPDADKNEVLVTGMRGTRRTHARHQVSLSPTHVALVHLRADAWSPCVASSIDGNNVSAMHRVEAFLLELFIHLKDGDDGMAGQHHVWRLDWVAPESGEVTRTDEIASQDGRLTISVPSFERDRVILLTKIKELEISSDPSEAIFV